MADRKDLPSNDFSETAPNPPINKHHFSYNIHAAAKKHSDAHIVTFKAELVHANIYVCQLNIVLVRVVMFTQTSIFY